MATSANTMSNYSQVPTDPEKGQTASLLPAAHRGYSSVYLHGQPVSVIPGVQDLQAQRSRGKRFCVRLIHWLVLDLFLAIIIIFIFKDFNQIANAFRAVFPVGPANARDDHGIHLPYDCVEVAEWNLVDSPHGHHGYAHSVETNVDVPVSSDLLYFLSRGHLSHGVIQFVDTGAQESDVAHVNVKFSYDRHHLADLVKVCRLSHEHEKKNGVGIFSPERSHEGGHSHHTKVEILVQLPSSAAIKALDTHLPLFLHEVGDFRNSVTFGRAELKTSNLPIIAKFLTADKISLRTTNSHISGSFNSSEAIDIFTSNSPIIGEFYLSNDAEKTNYPSHVSLRTSNGHIAAEIYLSSALANHTKGAFNVDTHTSNSPLNVTFSAAPLKSRVSFTGGTSNSHATATLHETFDGRFSVQTGRWFEAGVHILERDDPSGEGKKRNVTRVTTHRGLIQGRATWGDGDGDIFGTSYAELVTTNSPVHLYL